ncbi:MAG: SET domain-containing protein [Planctomycetota bacterium]|nr:MAG: SET domain-containing protein [Planctomycetota bacterium]
MSNDSLSARKAERDRLLALLETSPTHVGLGVFARRRLKSGMVIGEIHGEVCDEHPEDPHYCMELPTGRVLEPSAPLRFLNHSCDPNCELFYWCEEDETPQEDRLWLQTIRAIEPGEELLIDYCWPADAAIPCQCGAEGCRKWIVDPDELHLITNPAEPPSEDGKPV